MNLNDALNLLRTAMDVEDEAREVYNKAAEKTAEAEEVVHSLMRKMDMDSPGTKVAASGLAVTVREKWKAKYEPEKWGEVVDWMRSLGRDDLVQRRLNDTKIMDLVDNGVPLPDGLAVESFKQLEVRRTK